MPTSHYLAPKPPSPWRVRQAAPAALLLAPRPTAAPLPVGQIRQPRLEAAPTVRHPCYNAAPTTKGE